MAQPAAIFSGMSFCFPITDATLSAKLIDILKEQIRNAGGDVFSLGQKWKHPKHYYIVSQSANQNKVKKIVEESKGSVVSYTWVRKCLQEKKITEPDAFFLCAPKTIFPPIINSQKQQISHTQPIEKQLSPKEDMKRPRDEDVNSQLSAEDTHFKKQKGEYIKVKSIFGETEDSADEMEITTYNNASEDEENIRRNKFWDDKKGQFVCQKKPQPAFSQPLNEFICQQLTRLQKIYEVQKDKGRACAYRKAIAAIKGLGYEIKEERDVIGIKHIGPKIMEKIMQLIETGKMIKLEGYRKDEKYQVIDDLCGIWGIGPQTAIDLYGQGVKSIEDLRNREDLLTKNQRMGLKYLEQFRKKIPRDEVAAILDIVRLAVIDITNKPNLHLIQACGSFRRGKDFCGDIDIIITRKDGVFQPNLLFTLISRLKEQDVITDHLTIPRMHQEHESFSYMGVCRYQEGYHRRIDIKYYPLEQFAFALLYFTGSDYFNRSMRLFAKKKGYSLSDRGLTPVVRGTANQKIQQGKKIMCFTQKDIFDYLGLDYMLPEDRKWELPSLI